MTVMQTPPTDGAGAELAQRLRARTATVGVIGLGYVGLPLLASAAGAGLNTLGFDIDPQKAEAIRAGRSYIEAVASSDLAALVEAGTVDATSDFAQLAACDVIVICVPTPLNRYREPDLSYVKGTARTIAAHARAGQLIILESTTYPGTTEEVMRPILESSGLTSGSDIFLGFSPEREDPGNTAFNTVTIPKVVAGDGPQSAALVETFYSAFVDKVVLVSSPSAAEAVKITENVFRAVNIALVNELKVIYEAMGVDVWEVIDAAATKPFGYMPFYPGPGLGGHCIPIDPFYLTWKAREYDISTRFIELAGEINVTMPARVIAKLDAELDRRHNVPMSRSRVLLLGIAYKKNVSDVRESPSFKLLELMTARGVTVRYHDPHVPEIPQTREHAAFAGWTSVALSAEEVAAADAVLIATDHSAVDYDLVVRHARLIIDTRNAVRRAGLAAPQLVLA